MSLYSNTNTLIWTKPNPFPSYNSFHSPLESFHKILDCMGGNFYPFILQSFNDVRHSKEGLAYNSCSCSFQKGSEGLGSRPSSQALPHINPRLHSLYFVHQGSVMLEQKWALPKLLPQVGSMAVSERSSEALGLPFTLEISGLAQTLNNRVRQVTFFHHPPVSTAPQPNVDRCFYTSVTRGLIETHELNN